MKFIDALPASAEVAAELLAHHVAAIVFLSEHFTFIVHEGALRILQKEGGWPIDISMKDIRVLVSEPDEQPVFSKVALRQVRSV